MPLGLYFLFLDAKFLTIHDGVCETEREVLRTKQPSNCLPPCPPVTGLRWMRRVVIASAVARSPRRAPTWTKAEPLRCCARTRSIGPDAPVDLREYASARPASSCLFRTVSRTPAASRQTCPTATTGRGSFSPAISSTAG